MFDSKNDKQSEQMMAQRMAAEQGMNQFGANSDMASMAVSPAELNSAFTEAMQRVYMWMSMGLLITGVVSYFVFRTPALLFFIFDTPYLLFGLFLGQIGLVVAISGLVGRVSPSVSLGLFFLYSATLGLTMSSIFVAYTFADITLAFGVTAVTFGVMSVIGMTTKQDLSGWGSFLLMGLIGLVVASVANWFFQNGTLEWIISYGGVLLFLGLTVYDTQKIKNMTAYGLMTGQDQLVARVGVMGALALYLDFINLFLFILRIFGGRRN